MEINSSSVFFGPCAPLPILTPTRYVRAKHRKKARGKNIDLKSWQVEVQQFVGIICSKTSPCSVYVFCKGRCPAAKHATVGTILSKFYLCRNTYVPGGPAGWNS